MQHVICQVEDLNFAEKITLIESTARQISGVADAHVDFASSTLTVDLESAVAFKNIRTALYRIGVHLRNPNVSSVTDIEVPTLGEQKTLAAVEQLLKRDDIFRFSRHSSKNRIAVFHRPQVTSADILCLLNNNGVYANSAAWLSSSKQVDIQDIRTLFSASLVFIAFALENYAPSMLFWAYTAYTISLLISGWELARKGVFLAFKKRQLDVSTLALVGTLGALVLDRWMEASFIGIAFSAIQMAERKALQKVKDHLKALKSNLPVIGRILLEDDQVETRAAKDINENFVLAVKSGELVAVDGEVIHGHGSVDDRTLSDDRNEKQVKPGDKVFAGMRLLKGNLHVAVLHKQHDSVFAQAIAQIENAKQTTIPQQQALAKITNWLTISLTVGATFIFAYAFYPDYGYAPQWTYTSLVLLLIAGSASFPVAIHIAFLTALLKAAHKGVFIKDGKLWKSLSQINTALVDKALILTTQKYEVQEVVALQGGSINEVLQIAGAIALHEETARFNAIGKRLQESGHRIYDATHIEHVREQGVSATVNDTRYILGSYRLIRELNLVTPEVDNKILRWESDGNNAILLATDKQVIGLITLMDPLRQQIQTLVDTLHLARVNDVVLMTEDNIGPAKALSERYGYDHTFSELSRRERIELVEKYLAEGRKIIVFSNDKATCQAVNAIRITLDCIHYADPIHYGDIFILGDDANKASDLLKIAQLTISRVHQIAMAFFVYKACVITLALSGLLNLWMGMIGELGFTYIALSSALSAGGAGYLIVPKAAVRKANMITPTHRIRSIMR